MALQEEKSEEFGCRRLSAPAARFKLSGFNGYRERVIGNIRIGPAEGCGAGAREYSRLRWHEVNRHKPCLASRQAGQVAGERAAERSGRHAAARTHAGSPGGELEASGQLQREHHV